jgi:hypothetical protein
MSNIKRLGYGLHDWGSIPGGYNEGIFFFFRYRVQAGSGVHQPTVQVGTGGSFPRIKAAGAQSRQITTT